MPPKASRGHVVTKPSHGSDVESANIRRLPHRRPQKICTTERLPALISWALLLITSFAYWICVFPEIINLLPKLLPIFILHCILFIFLCCNFLLATFMDPVRYFERNSIFIFIIDRLIGHLRTINKKRISRY